MSILAIGAGLEGTYDYTIVDGNLDRAIFTTLPRLIREQGIKYVGFTVMPGPQLEQAIRLSKMIREQFPSVLIIWGGYFPTLHTKVVLGAPYVDFVIRDQGDHAFRLLIDALEHGGELSVIPGLSYKDGGIRHNGKQGLIDPNTLPALPYHRVDVRRYIGRTYVGTRTVNYHSSVGCPFLCGFCAVAASYKARWIGLEPERIVRDLVWFKREHGVNAVEFHDNNFFTSERRTAEFAERITGQGITWWGEARPDTLLRYDDATWRRMRGAGCKMIFMGAESSSQQVLTLMEKGGTQTPDTVLELAGKMRRYGIVPEFSFVLGSPTPTVEEDIEADIRFIKKVKTVNPASEIVIYVYSPVHFEDAELYSAARTHQFSYPETLDAWLQPEWKLHDLRKNPVTPWLRKKDINRIRNFERVLNAVYPTVSDLKLRGPEKFMLKVLGGWRYRLSLYALPYEIAAAQRMMRYRQPEIEGF
ncbi:MAG TPA: radical SAM protein [Bacteroidota bacterium]